MLTVAVIGIFVVWFSLSILGQIDCKALTWVKAHDHFSLIPRWTFFAPRPGMTDYHLLFELYSGENAGPSGWHEEELADPRTLWGSVWNPLKRNKKALCDTVHSLGRMARELDPSSLWQVQYSVPYLAALSYLAGRPYPEFFTHIRFMILESDGFYVKQEPRLLFLSAKHSLG